MGETAGSAGFGNDASAKDELIRSGGEETEKLRELALIPDPPATLVCEICSWTTEKNADTMGMEHCGRPMREEQRNKAVDFDILKRLLGRQ